MGAQLIDERTLSDVPWLDAATNRFLRRLITLAVSMSADVEAVILFGSAARQELRPLSEDETSDVDVLFVMSPSSDARHPGHITREQHLAVSLAEVEAYPSTFDDTMRQVQTILASRSFVGWDTSFVENIARDGILLWARGELPAAIAPVAQRPLSARTKRQSG